MEYNVALSTDRQVITLVGIESRTGRLLLAGATLDLGNRMDRADFRGRRLADRRGVGA